MGEDDESGPTPTGTHAAARRRGTLCQQTLCGRVLPRWLCGGVRKACIARHVRRGEFPDLGQVRKSYTHDLAQLVSAADLTTALRAQIARDQDFSANWAFLATRWSETARYEFRTQIEARDILAAVSDQRSGVLPWLKMYW